MATVAASTPLPPPMFGCVVAGRLVQTNLQQVDASKFVFVLEDARTINHLAVFLTGAIAFPPGYGATVHFGWPKSSGMTWQFLGSLTNDKPSAIYKVSIFKSPTSASSSSDMVDDEMTAEAPGGQVQAQLGIAMEPLEAIQNFVSQAGLNQVAVRSSTAPEPSLNDYVVITKRILDHFYNFVTSFLGTGNDLPTKIIHAWYQNVERKLKLDPEFWRRASSA